MHFQQYWLDCAFYAGMLPSFAECKQLMDFDCDDNQFAGVYSCGDVIQWIGVYVQTYRQLCSFVSKLTWLACYYAGSLPSFAECKQLEDFNCFSNQFTGKLVVVYSCSFACPGLHPGVFCFSNVIWLVGCNRPASKLCSECEVERIQLHQKSIHRYASGSL